MRFTGVEKNSFFRQTALSGCETTRTTSISGYSKIHEKIFHANSGVPKNAIFILTF
jgi:hypothetical protein